MRNNPIGVGIGLLFGVLALASPAFADSGDSHLRINPGDGSPGSTVTVTATGCAPGETFGKGESKAAGSFQLFEGDHEGELTGEFTIPEGQDLGTDTVTVKCPPKTMITDTYEIGGREPGGAVAAGFGDIGDNQAQLAVGGALVAAAGAGYVVRMRRRPHGVRG
ncbi:sortase [Streptomyces adustus]|uniref:Sortase n=1 Tax=Streptomyces adustus TaxID=1609272 RepID=A0A5N8VGW2_9ACTN|nr:sortase [Streptomyces adustus]MPY33902.1 sortase [Streptomyces adustus]